MYLLHSMQTAVKSPSHHWGYYEKMDAAYLPFYL